MLTTPLILCPSARLARSIQADIAQQQLSAGKTQWQSADVQTLQQWLNNTVESALLSGEVQTQALPNVLSPLSERLLWQEVIAESLKKNAFGSLFDVSGLANAAMEANRYMVAWHLHVPREYQAEESRQLMQWQRAFQARCHALNVLENVRYLDWQLDCLKQIAHLPAQIAFAGFDQTAPQEQRLRDLLAARGVEVTTYATTLPKAGVAQHVSLANQEAESRAAVAWAQQTLRENPNAKLAIVVPNLSEARTQLADLLDDVFNTASVRPSAVQGSKLYNFSLGLPLNQQPIIQAALQLLRLLSSYTLQQADVSAILLSPFWSASMQEADARARLDAVLREQLPMRFSLNFLLAFAQRQFEAGLPLTQFLAHLEAAMASASASRLTPSQWAEHFDTALNALNWPGERSMSSVEYQTLNAWHKALQQLTGQNVISKKLTQAEAVQLISQICSEQVFQPETEGTPAIQILGIMEALSAPVDALWCMHMNDAYWPPPARPNALLPAFIQRAAQVPNADSAVQTAFAQTIHQRLLHSAKAVIFSSSQMLEDSPLRVSPLMKAISTCTAEKPLALTLAEQLVFSAIDSTVRSELVEDANADGGSISAARTGLVHLDDHTAPAIQAGEHVSGGTGLFKAQAICPAWAFYQYRLGAKALKTPSNGLDNLDRGSLVHDALAQFWHPNQQYRHFTDLRDMPEADLNKAVATAVAQALNSFTAQKSVLTPTLRTLEQERLEKLINAWLLFEKSRGVAFSTIACEVEKKVDISGIEVTLKIDRIHALEDGRWAFVDYKTGQIPKMQNWAQDRITEPQLPMYALFYAPNQAVIGVQFAVVKLADHAFTGVGDENFAAEADKRKPNFIREFTDWPQLLTHWKASIEAIAHEIKTGEARVQLNDENDLKYCEIKALLRLPERALQFERMQEDAR